MAQAGGGNAQQIAQIAAQLTRAGSETPKR